MNLDSAISFTAGAFFGLGLPHIKSALKEWRATREALKEAYQLGEYGQVCRWQPDRSSTWRNGAWEGACGIKWAFATGDPEAHGVNYCPRCGRAITQVVKEVQL